MLQVAAIVALLSFAAGAAGSFMLTDWWNGVNYSSAVKDAVKEQQGKQAKSEAILRAQIKEAQKTHIKYRTIRSRANEITVYRPCLNDSQRKLWNEATAAANGTEASISNGAVREITDALKIRRKPGAAKSH